MYEYYCEVYYREQSKVYGHQINYKFALFFAMKDIIRGAVMLAEVSIICHLRSAEQH